MILHFSNIWTKGLMLGFYFVVSLYGMAQPFLTPLMQTSCKISRRLQNEQHTKSDDKTLGVVCKAATYLQKQRRLVGCNATLISISHLKFRSRFSEVNLFNQEMNPALYQNHHANENFY